MSTRSDLAVAYERVGRFEEAISLQERALAEAQLFLGPEHRDTLNARSRPAAVYWAVGRVGEAIRLHALDVLITSVVDTGLVLNMAKTSGVVGAV
ncbi:tetratricopeptide repeat protein [Streptomyces sp. NPDC046371]|uniref:tetratricopeptide repeat protein n=1 Tax=unclassified Streptomyces TaxID=2593676 RepID=UPI0033EDDBFA